MPDFIGLIRTKPAYALFVLAVLWAVVAGVDYSLLVAWPVLLFGLSGVFLLFRPTNRFTWALSISTISLGLLLCLYQAYSAATIIGGAFQSLGVVSLVAFAVFTVGHVFVLYAYATAG